MKRWLQACSLLACLLMAAPAISFAEDGDDSNPLGVFRWRYRLLVVLYNEKAEDRLRGVILPEKAAVPSTARTVDFDIADRDLLLICLDCDHEAMEGSEDWWDRRNQWLEEQFPLGESGVRTVLIGKDGGIKLDRPEVVPWEEIFALIDAMPMRQAEMRQRDE